MIFVLHGGQRHRKLRVTILAHCDRGHGYDNARQRREVLRHLGGGLKEISRASTFLKRESGGDNLLGGKVLGASRPGYRCV